MPLRSRVLSGLALVGAAALGCSAQSVPGTSGSHGLARRTVRQPVAFRPAVENAHWRVHRYSGSGRIEGYADHDSVAAGTPVTLYVSTTARRFTVRVFRMGWYGGTEGRLVDVRRGVRGHVQRSATLSQPLNMAQARWSPSTVLQTADWQPGDYLLRLDGHDGAQSYVPLTVRGPAARGRVVLVTPTATWQAYNLWGCCDLYAGPDGSFATRSRAVSFDRPYLTWHGAAQFVDRELPVVVAAERLGLHLDYVTDTDLESTPGLLDGAAAIISMGHDEYWSPRMRAAVTAARNAGTNVAFLGANAVYRRIRFTSSRLGPDRVVVDYKIASEDPLDGADPAAVTSDWPQPPNRRPESSLTGAMYNCFDRMRAPGVVTSSSSPLFAGTGVHRGTQLPQLVGPETDIVNRADPTPRHLVVLMHSPFTCPPGTPSYADTTIYTARSGAQVFDSGTMSWVAAMNRHDVTGRVVRQITDNLLVAFSHGPAVSLATGPRQRPGTP